MTTTTDDAFVSKTTQELLNAREAMEIEMQAIASRLTAPNAPGLRGALTDADGFPIAGCDLYAVRADRGRYDVLRNDYKRIMTELESRVIRGMQGDGEVMKGVGAPTPTPTPTEDAAPTENDVGRAFMVIDEIMDGCPGEVDGLRVGDRVCAVGNVTWGFEDPSASPPAEVLRNATQTFADNENSVVRVVVLRRGERVAVEVTPRAWSGRGLVGCHMRSV